MAAPKILPNDSSPRNHSLNTSYRHTIISIVSADGVSVVDRGTCRQRPQFIAIIEFPVAIDVVNDTSVGVQTKESAPSKRLKNILTFYQTS
jgi:hypothetical protein